MNEVRRSSNFWRLLVAAASMVRDFLMGGHRMVAAIWPHGTVAGSPAAQGAELDDMGKWMKLPRLGFGRTSVSDDVYRRALQRPFSWHQMAGTMDGLLRAVEALGYSNVRYLAFDELTDCPTWVPPGETLAVLNPNTFGLACDAFPANWLASDAAPVDSDLQSLIAVVMRSKRASARFWEIRAGESRVVTQAWWEGPQDLTAIEYVGEQVGADRTFVTVKRGA